MKRHDDRQRSDRLVVTQPLQAPSLRTEKQLTAPADRPVRAFAHLVPFTTAASVRGAGSAIAEPHPKQTTSVLSNLRKEEVKMILKEPWARAA